MKLSLPANDVFGGLVSAAVAIPLAMGYGMFAFAPLGENYFEDGALAGIVSAFVAAIACVLLGDKTTTVYAPRVTSTFFLGLLIFGLAPKVPPMLVGIGLGCILYYLVKLAGLGGYLGPIIASGPRVAIGPTAFPYFAGLVHAGNFVALMPMILGGAVALAIIASIDALLCAKLVRAPGEPRRDGDQLLMRLGVGNLAAACIGGITGGINIGPSIANRAFGARTRLSVLVNAVALLIAGTLLFPLLGQIPRVVLSAVIMVIAVQHFDVWGLRLVRGLRRGPAAHRFNVALDLAVVVAVAVLSIAINIVLAVFVGVAIAVALFVFRMSRSIIRRSYRCGAIHSRTSRTEPDRAFLERSGDAILVMELQGALFFGTGEKMLSEVETAVRRETSCVILDLHRLTEVDSTGAHVLLELKTNLVQRNTELLLAAARQTIAMERLENFGVLSSLGDANIVPDVDRGIQRAEDDLLRTQPQLHDAEMPLTEIGVFAGFNALDLKAIEPYLNRASYSAGTIIFRENEVGNEMLIVTKGNASAYLQMPNTSMRLATFAPGTIFGELAILDPGVRSATVIADKELVCRTLTTSNFAALSARLPSVAIRLLAAIARELSGRLRTANRTIHQLDT